MCEHCGADIVLNPKTGKQFCAEKCWLKGQPQQQPRTQFVRQGGDLKVKDEPNWDKINAEKSEGYAKGAAFNKACDIVIAMYQKGDVLVDMVVPAVKEMFEKLKEINLENGTGN
jgi:hypothetical protein